jgi:hypothetical protein
LCLNVTGVDAPIIEGEILSSKPAFAGLPLGNQERFKPSMMIAGNGDLGFTKLAFDRFLAVSVAAIFGVLWGRIEMFLFQVIV